MKYKGLVLADLHIDVKDIYHMYHEITEVLFKYIESLDKLDFLIVCGDYFDHKEFLNDSGSYYSYKILDELFTLIYDKMKFNTKIRFVYGTESHECNQYDILETLIHDRDIKLIRYASEEELFPNVQVLYLPEEHLENPDKYYSEFLNNERKYNYIFGHGIIQEIMKEACVAQNNSSKRKRVPIFTVGMLLKMCKGQTYFGHYHINSEIDDSIFYVGSFTRWQFGEEEPKGFYEITYDDEKDSYKNEFIENYLAPTYKTISYGYGDTMFNSIDTMETKLKSVDKMIKDGVFDNVRLQFNIPTTSENPEMLIKFIKDKYKFNKNIKTNIVHGYIAEKEEKSKEVINEKLQKYGVLFDKSVSIEDKVSQFIDIEFSRKIEPKKVSMYLYKSLSDIMNNKE